jgi:uncharacterized protein
MMSRRLALFAGAVLLLCGSLFTASSASAQQPTPAAISMAKEILDVKGSFTMFEPIVPGVIETAKNVFLQQSPNLQKDLNETAAALRTQLAPRTAELKEEIAKLYAVRFTEAELKDALGFFKSPLGKKLLIEEPRFVEGSLGRAQEWANRLSEDVMGKFRAEMKKKGHNL